MNILDKKWFGILLMVILIVAGSFAGCVKTIHGLYSNVEKIFFYGEDNDGVCIANDLESRVEDTVNLASIASKYLDADSPELKAAKQCASDLAAASEIREKKARDDSLSAAFSALYRELEEYQLSDSDEKYRGKLYADFRSRAETISHDPYNEAAVKYNKRLDSFPASLVSRLTGGQDAALFY